MAVISSWWYTCDIVILEHIPSWPSQCGKDTPSDKGQKRGGKLLECMCCAHTHSSGISQLHHDFPCRGVYYCSMCDCVVLCCYGDNAWPSSLGGGRDTPMSCLRGGTPSDSGAVDCSKGRCQASDKGMFYTHHSGIATCMPFNRLIAERLSVRHIIVWVWQVLMGP